MSAWHEHRGTFEKARLETITMIGAHELKTILERITDRLAGSVDSPYDVVIQIAMETTGAQACSLYLEEPSGDGQGEPEFIKMVSGAGFEQHRIGIKYRKNEGLTGSIWATSKSVKADTQAEVEDPRKGWSGRNNVLVREKVQGWKSYSLIGLPLRIGERTMGVLKVENKQPGPPSHFSEDDQLTLELIASTIALALEDHRRSEESSGLTLNALREVSEMLVGRGTLTFTLLCDSIVEKCIEVYKAEACSLYLGDTGSAGAAEPEYIIMLSGVGYEQNRKGIARYAKGQGLTGTIWRNGIPVKYDTQKELENPANGWSGLYNDQVRQNVKGWVCASLIGVPLRVGDRIIGVLKVENKKPVGQTHFTYNELRTLEILAANIALSLEMRRHYEDLFRKGEHARAFAHDAVTLVGTAVLSTTDARNALRVEGPASTDVSVWLENAWNSVKALAQMLESLKSADTLRRRVPTSLRHLLESIQRRCAQLIKTKGIDLEVQCLDPDVFVNLNEDQILEAFDNLMGNAIEALDDVAGPRWIQLKARPTGQEDTTVTASTTGVVIRLVDSGPGFSKQQRLDFDAHRRLKSTKPSGSGMGLYLVDTIFRDNEITWKIVDPPPDVERGAAFEISLYTCVPRALRILIVDDVKPFTDRLAQQAVRLGDVQIECRNSSELLTQAATKEGSEARQKLGTFDRILLDCRFDTGPDGPTLLKRLHEQDSTLAHRVILMSSVPDYTARHDVRVLDKFAGIAERFHEFLQDLRQELTDADSDHRRSS